MDEKRFLKYHFPDLEKHAALPANFEFIQLFTGITIDEQGKSEQLIEPDTIHAKAYQIPSMKLYPIFHKPISKFIIINHKDGNFTK